VVAKLRYLLFSLCLARTKGAGHGFTVWITVSRAAENEREEGVDLVHNLPLVPLSCLANYHLALRLSLPPWWCIATLLVQCWLYYRANALH
jgi:hypothetical protein